MGFFSGIARIIGGVAKTFLGVPAAPVQQAAVRQVTGLGARGAARLTAGRRVVQAVAPVAAGVAGGALLTSLPHPGPINTVDPVTGMHVHMGGGGMGGNGVVARQTVVQTIDLRTGAVLRQEVFSGAPFLMASDVRKLRAVSRKVSKAHQKLIGRTRKPSKKSQLTDAILDSALNQVLTRCPTKS